MGKEMAGVTDAEFDELRKWHIKHKWPRQRSQSGNDNSLSAAKTSKTKSDRKLNRKSNKTKTKQVSKTINGTKKSSAKPTEKTYFGKWIGHGK